MSEKIWSDDAWADYLYWQTLWRQVIFIVFFYKQKNKQTIMVCLNIMPATGIEPVRVSLPTGF